MRIGLIGEDPNDTNSIKNLLISKYEHVYIPVLKRLRGSKLDSPKYRRMLDIELSSGSFDLLIFIRDLDALETSKTQLERRKEWYNELSGLTETPSIFLLNIYELEALILSDITTFNTIYRASIDFKSDPMYIEDPKGFLINSTKKLQKKYSVSDNPLVFANLEFETVQKSCRYFRIFIQDINKLLN